MRRRSGARHYYDSSHYAANAVARSLPGKLAVSDAWYRLALEILERHRLEVRGRVLEVGCGLGGFCNLLASKASFVAGADFSLAALSEARRQARPGPGRTTPRFVAADARRLPFRDRSFDLVVCAETIEHTFAVGACVGELFRVCAPGGSVVVTVPNAITAVPLGLLVHALRKDQPQILVTYFRLRRAMERAGFVVVDGDGTNMFRDMILNDVLSATARERARRIGTAIDRAVSCGKGLWKLTAGTIALLGRVPAEERTREAEKRL